MNEKEAWEMWEKEFHNAKRFFTSIGDTKERHKVRWYKEFIQMITRQK